ncbi:transcription factor ilr3 [Phtheirospermum japonicum]|uniref:Transcription factor ilr3 n=1 Tax=Phtheirospermum japonicum TaxID=374723 RepID=A0A830B7V4_9LAMI|nr:transcription factor ilr3 [Phtheirospermum japonicum]
MFMVVEIDGSLGESDVPKETGTKKRSRTEACAPSSSKACREKLRRDKLNDRFIELAALLEPGRPPKTDKSAILADAVRMVTQLRGESGAAAKDNERSTAELFTGPSGHASCICLQAVLVA